MSGFTPGPWEVREHEGLFAFAWERGFVMESDSVEQNRIDARLIAAAPEMLAALQEAIPLCVMGCDSLVGMSHEMQAANHDRLNKIRAAIAKATGETK